MSLKNKEVSVSSDKAKPVAEAVSYNSTSKAVKKEEKRIKKGDKGVFYSNKLGYHKEVK